MKILEAYHIRKSWRGQRVEDAKNEKKVFRDLKNSLTARAQALIPLGHRDEDGRPQTSAEQVMDRISSIVRSTTADRGTAGRGVSGGGMGGSIAGIGGIAGGMSAGIAGSTAAAL